MFEDAIFSLYRDCLLICYHIRLVGFYFDFFSSWDLSNNVIILYSYIIFWINQSATGIHVSVTFFLTIGTFRNLIDSKLKKIVNDRYWRKVYMKMPIDIIIDKTITLYNLLLHCILFWLFVIFAFCFYLDRHTIQSFFLLYWYQLKDPSLQQWNHIKQRNIFKVVLHQNKKKEL